MRAEDVDRRIAAALKKFSLFAALVSDLDIAEDGTGTAVGFDQNGDTDTYDVEVCAGSFGFRSRPMKGAGGLMLKLGGEGASAVIVGFRDRQYEISVGAGESAAFSAAGAYTKWTSDGEGNGDVESMPAGTGKVKLGGDDHPAPKFDLYQDKINKLLKVLSVIVLSNCDPAGGPLAGTLLAPIDRTLGATNADALAQLILDLAVDEDFQSEKVSNG